MCVYIVVMSDMKSSVHYKGGQHYKTTADDNLRPTMRLATGRRASAGPGTG